VAVQTSSGSKEEKAVRMSAIDKCNRKKYILKISAIFLKLPFLPNKILGP